MITAIYILCGVFWFGLAMLTLMVCLCCFEAVKWLVNRVRGRG